MEKQYSLKLDDGEIVSIEIDGVHYDSPDQIPDPDDRARIMQLMFASPQAAAMPSGTSISLSKIVFGVFLATAVILLAVAVLTGISTSRALSREASAPGYVVDLVTRSDSDGQIYYYPLVEFTLQDGSQQAVQLAEGSWPPAYTIGEPVTVRYDPEHSLTARIQSTAGTLGMWIWTLISGTLGLAFIAAAFFARWIASSEPEMDDSPAEAEMSSGWSK